MSHTTALVADLRDFLVDGGVTGQIAIGPILQGDSGVALTPFPVEDDTVTGASLVGVQVRIRGAQSTGGQPVLERQDAIYDLITSLHFRVLGEAHVSVAWRDRSVPISSDAEGRYQVFDTYYLRTNR